MKRRSLMASATGSLVAAAGCSGIFSNGDDGSDSGPTLEITGSNISIDAYFDDRLLKGISLTVENTGRSPVEIGHIKLQTGGETEQINVGRTVTAGESVSFTASRFNPPTLSIDGTTVRLSVVNTSGVELAATSKEVPSPDVTVTSVEPEYTDYGYSDDATLDALTLDVRNDGGLLPTAEVSALLDDSPIPTFTDIGLEAGERTTVDISVHAVLEAGTSRIEVRLEYDDRVLATGDTTVEI